MKHVVPFAVASALALGVNGFIRSDDAIGAMPLWLAALLTAVGVAGFCVYLFERPRGGARRGATD